jgi:hypothetical protein
MAERTFRASRDGHMWDVLQDLPQAKPHRVASFINEAQAIALCSCLNDLDRRVMDAATLIRRQRAQLQSVGSMLFALMREIRVVDGPNLDVKCTPAFQQRWHEAMELLIVLSNEGIPGNTIPSLDTWKGPQTVEVVKLPGKPSAN